MVQLKSKFDDYVSKPTRRRIYEEESLAFDAAELVSELMERDSVSKVKLAERLGASKPHVTSLLSGSRNMTLHTLADLTFALGHKIELKAVRLDAAAHWQDTDALYKRKTGDPAYRKSEFDLPEDTHCDGILPEDYELIA